MFEKQRFSSRCSNHGSMHVQYACVPSRQVLTTCHANIEIRGNNMDEPVGQLRSPGHPDFYPGPIICEWRIKALSGQKIRITMNDLKLRYYDENTLTSQCADYVTVSEHRQAARRRLSSYQSVNDYNFSKKITRTTTMWPLSADRLLWRTCASLEQAALTTNENMAYVRLYTNSMWTSRGLWIRYEAIGCATPQLPDDVTVVFRNDTSATFRCPYGHIFKDKWFPYNTRIVECIDSNTVHAYWSKTLPDCTNDKQWLVQASSSSLPRRTEFVILALIIGLLLILACALAIWFLVGRRSSNRPASTGSERRQLQLTSTDET